MPPSAGLGEFASKFVSGALARQDMDLRQARDAREAEDHRLSKKIKELGIARAEKEQPVLDKELQVRGAKADFDLTERGFLSELQAFDQETRRITSQTSRTQAQLQSGEAAAALQNQPDELAVKREELSSKLLDATRRQTANIWSVLKLGNTELALKMYNDSSLVDPGAKAKGFRLEDVQVPGANGGPATTAKVLVVEGEDGKQRRFPVSSLDQLENQFGAKYEKVGNSIVRITRDGKAAPVYQQDKFQHTGDGDIYSETTGEIKTPAAGGLGGGAGGGLGRAKKLDDRVKMAIDKVILPQYGGRFEGGMYFPDEANKDVALRATELAGTYVRQGMDPEAAGTKAIQQANREKALRDTTKNPREGGGYNGPRPWVK